MKIFKLISRVGFFIPLGFLCFSACGKSVDENRSQDEDKLFESTCRLTKQYIDSLEHAPDSAALNAIMARFDNQLTSLNFSVRAETDYRLTEGRNDTIASLLDSLRRIYDERLHNLAHIGDVEAETDSVANPENSMPAIQ